MPNDVVKYGIWKEGKNIRWIKSEEYEGLEDDPQN